MLLHVLPADLQHHTEGPDEHATRRAFILFPYCLTNSVFSATDCILDLSDILFSRTFGFRLLVADHFTDGFFDRAGSLFTNSFETICIHHDVSFSNLLPNVCPGSCGSVVRCLNLTTPALIHIKVGYDLTKIKYLAKKQVS